MLWFKKYKDKVEDTHKFLESHAIRLNAMLVYVEENETVSKKMIELREKFSFAVAPEDSKELKPYKEAIEQYFVELKEKLSPGDWDEKEVITILNNRQNALGEYTAVRV